jgi:hypothetical protein
MTATPQDGHLDTRVMSASSEVPAAAPTEGWQVDKHPRQRVYHYIGPDTMALCGKLGFYRGELAPDEPTKRSREDCKACAKKLDGKR